MTKLPDVELYRYEDGSLALSHTHDGAYGIRVEVVIPAEVASLIDDADIEEATEAFQSDGPVGAAMALATAMEAKTTRA